MTATRTARRYPRLPRLLISAALVFAASTSWGTTPERYTEQFEFAFEQGKYTLSPEEIKKFSAAFAQLKRQDWCPAEVVVFGARPPGKAATTSEARMLASHRLAYLNGVVAAFEWANNQPQVVVAAVQLATVDQHAMLIVAGRCN